LDVFALWGLAKPARGCPSRSMSVLLQRRVHDDSFPAYPVGRQFWFSGRGCVADQPQCL